MKKSLGAACLFAILIMSCLLGLTGCKENNWTPKNLEKIFLTVDKEEANVGEAVTLSYSSYPKIPNYAHDGKEYSMSGVKFYSRINGIDTLISENKTQLFYGIKTADDVTFWAKYCNHPFHSDTEGDLVSEPVTVKIPTISISTVEDLKNLGDKNKSYVLENDIDLSEEENWKPISEFSGTLTGNGYSIINLKINSANDENVGLFSTLKGTVRNLNVQNAQISTRGDVNYVGIIAGTNQGVISNVKVSGNISSEYYDSVGGLVGYNNNGKVIDCTNQANIVASNNVGGIVGSALIDKDEAITNCTNEGTITGKDNVGGISGYLRCVRSNATYQISNHTNNNIVTGNSSIGGIFGYVYAFYESYNYKDYNSYFQMSYLENNAEIVGSSTGYDVGGLIGKATRLKLLTFCDNHADISGGTTVGGFVGYAPDTNINASGVENNNRITGNGKVGGFAGHAGVIENAKNNGEIISFGTMVEGDKSKAYAGGIAGYCTGLINCINNVDITSESNGDYVGGLAGYVIVSASDRVNNNVNYGSIDGCNYVGGIAGYLTCVRSNATYQVTNNENNSPINGNSQVGGIFGEVHAFYQFYNYKDYNSYFAMTLLINKAEVTGSPTGNDTGGLVGNGARLNLLTSCENTADVTGGMCVGGFVGYSPETNIKASGVENNNTIKGSLLVGGFAGRGGVIENAKNNGEVIATGKNENSQTYLGGIAGYCAGLIDCENNADIKINIEGLYVGGLAGYVLVSASDRVNSNVNYGLVSGYKYVGGNVGYLTCVRSNATYLASDNKNYGAVNGYTSVGGVFGEVYAFYESYNYKDYNSYFEMSALINAAVINGNLDGHDTGGIIGKATRLKLLTAIENTADISGGICVGGIVGYAPDTNIKAGGTANNNKITGNYKVGGIAGQCGIVEDAKNNGEVVATGKDDSGQTFLGGIAGYCKGAINCSNNMDITLLNDGLYVGGIAGYISLSETDKVYGNINSGKIIANNYVGGIVGYITCVRSNATYRLSDNQNKNIVQGKNYVGGIVGYAYAFYEKYNYKDYNSYFEIVNSRNEAEIIGVEKVGGICGGYARLKTTENLMDTNTTLFGNKLGQ